MKIISTQIIDGVRQIHDVDMNRDAMAELEAWQSAAKAHSVMIDHDDGYGTSSWGVSLSRGFGGKPETIRAAEWWGYDPEEPPGNPAYLYACFDRAPDDDFDDQVGLKATILAAVDEARRRWG